MNPSALPPAFNRSQSGPPLVVPLRNLRATLGLLFLAAVLPAQAEILVSENFSYTDGPVIETAASKWRHLNGTPGQIWILGDLLRPWASEFEIVETPLPGVPRNQGPLYAGFTVNVGVLPRGAGGYVAAFSAADGPRTLGRLFVTTQGAAPGKFRLGVAEALDSPTATLPMDFALATSCRVVLRHQLPSHRTTLWVNPTSEETGGVDPADSTFPGSIAAFAFRQQNSISIGMGNVAVDDLVVATTFDEAKTPPPPPNSPPLDPQLLGRWEGHDATDVKAAGNYAYVAANHGLFIWRGA